MILPNRLARSFWRTRCARNIISAEALHRRGLQRRRLLKCILKSGVTDPVAESVTAAMADMGVNVENVRTARKYILLGQLSATSRRDLIAKKILANDCIEDVIIGSDAEPPSPHLKPYELNLTAFADTKP